MQKASKGNLIKSYHVNGMPERGWIGGTVQKVEVDSRDGVEYVYFSAEFETKSNNEVLQLAGDKTMRVPQNGTPTTMGDILNCIEIVPRYNEKKV